MSFPPKPGAKRCPIHLINFPTNYNRCLVPGCDEDLDYFTNIKVDEDYAEEARSFARLDEDNEVEEYKLEVIKHIHPDVAHLGLAAVPDCMVMAVAHYSEQEWVGHEALLRSGYVEPIKAFDVVMIHGKFYELQGRAHPEYKGGALTGGAWWIEEIDPAQFKMTDTPEEVIQIWQRS